MIRRLSLWLLLVATLVFGPGAGAQGVFLLAAPPSLVISSANGVAASDAFNNVYITFNADDVLLSSAPFVADVLIVGGGAGGLTGAGGGAGRVQYLQNVLLSTQTAIQVGLGGLGITGSLKGNAGGHSAVWLGPSPTTALVSTGGAAGAITNQNGPAWLSGSGSGVSSPSSGGPNYTGGTGEGLSGENPGGNTSTIASPFAGSGSGGAGGQGGAVTVAGQGGAAGLGISNSITGTPVIYGPGAPGIGFGNGGVGSTPGAAAPGGAAAVNGSNGGNGIDGTGGGGAGAFSANTGGKGGKGVIIIRPKGASFTVGTKTIQPSVAPITLPITANLAGFYSVIRLSTWNGNCLQVTRSSDSATQDIGFVNNACDWQSADQFAGATNSALTVSKIYDQSGRGNDLICSGTAGFGLPTFSGLNTWFGIRPISIEGQSAGGTIAFQKCANATIVGNTNAVSIYQVAAPRTSIDFQGYWSLNDATLATYFSNLYHNAGSNLRWQSYGVSTLDTGFYPIGTPGTISVSSSGTLGQIVRANGAQFTNSGNATSQAFGGVTIGLANNGTGLVSCIEDLFGFAIYNASHTSTQMASTEAAMTAPLSLQTTFTNQVVYGGNSLVTGYDSTANQQAPWQAGFGRSTNGPIPSWKPYIMGVAGRTLATENASLRALYAALFDATKAVNAIVISDPTNDIAGWTATSDADAQAQADALYTGTTLPFVAFLIAAGFNRVVVPTTMARTSISTASHLEAARLEYNAQVRAGAAANGYVVSDRALSSFAPTGAFNSPAAASDLTRYASGGTHFVNLGYLQGFALPDRAAIGAQNFLLKRDLDPAANDNTPAFLDWVA